MAETIGKLVGKGLRVFMRYFLIGLGVGLGLKVSGIL